MLNAQCSMLDAPIAASLLPTYRSPMPRSLGLICVALTCASLIAAPPVRRPNPAPPAPAPTQKIDRPMDHTTHPHPNRLAREKSPYLLQHQHNPVDWFPWG